MILGKAPKGYDQSDEARTRAALERADLASFKKGQDVRLLRGERFSLRSPDGTETFISIDDLGYLNVPGHLPTTVSGAGTLTLTKGGHYVFSGTTATWTLPAVASTPNHVIWGKNRGSGVLTVQRAGADQIYDTAAVTSITIAAGASFRLANDGTYWDNE